MRTLTTVFGADLADKVTAVLGDEANDLLDQGALGRSAKWLAAMSDDQMREQFGASDELVRLCREFQAAFGS